MIIDLEHSFRFVPAGFLLVALGIGHAAVRLFVLAGSPVHRCTAHREPGVEIWRSQLRQRIRDRCSTRVFESYFLVSDRGDILS